MKKILLAGYLLLSSLSVDLSAVGLEEHAQINFNVIRNMYIPRSKIWVWLPKLINNHPLGVNQTNTQNDTLLNTIIERYDEKCTVNLLHFFRIAPNVNLNIVNKLGDTALSLLMYNMTFQHNFDFDTWGVESAAQGWDQFGVDFDSDDDQAANEYYNQREVYIDSRVNKEITLRKADKTRAISLLINKGATMTQDKCADLIDKINKKTDVDIYDQKAMAQLFKIKHSGSSSNGGLLSILDKRAMGL